MNLKELSKLDFETHDYFSHIPNIGGNINFVNGQEVGKGVLNKFSANFTFNNSNKVIERHLIFSATDFTIDTQYDKTETKFNNPFKNSLLKYIFIGKENQQDSVKHPVHCIEGDLYVIHNPFELTPDFEKKIDQLLFLSNKRNKQFVTNYNKGVSFKKLKIISQKLKNYYDRIKNQLEVIENDIYHSNSLAKINSELSVKQEKMYPYDISDETNRYLGYKFFKLKVKIYKNGWIFLKKDTTEKNLEFFKLIDKNNNPYYQVSRFYKLCVYFIKEFFHKNDYHPINQDSITGITSLQLLQDRLRKYDISFDQCLFEIYKHQANFIKNAIYHIKKTKHFRDGDIVGFAYYLKTLFLNFYFYCSTLNPQHINKELESINNRINETTNFKEFHGAKPSMYYSEGQIRAFLIWHFPFILVFASIYKLTNINSIFNIGFKEVFIILAFEVFIAEIIRYIADFQINKRRFHNPLLTRLIAGHWIFKILLNGSTISKSKLNWIKLLLTRMFSSSGLIKLHYTGIPYRLKVFIFFREFRFYLIEAVNTKNKIFYYTYFISSIFLAFSLVVAFNLRLNNSYFQVVEDSLKSNPNYLSVFKLLMILSIIAILYTLRLNIKRIAWKIVTKNRFSLYLGIMFGAVFIVFITPLVFYFIFNQFETTQNTTVFHYLDGYFEGIKNVLLGAYDFIKNKIIDKST